MVKITEEWDEILKEEFNSPSYLELRNFLKSEYSNHTVYPPMYDIFNSMKHTAFKDVKVVLLGQDPYHNEGQAMGLSFSVPDGIIKPPSLVNMFKELKKDLEIIFCISAGDIERNKTRSDYGITYDIEILRLIEKFIEENPSPYYKGFKTQATVVEFAPHETSKAFALEKFCEMNDMSLEEKGKYYQLYTGAFELS